MNKYKGANILWKDKKRFWGMPLSFTRYIIAEKPGSWVKVFYDVGWLSTRHEEVHAYRIFDISIRQTLFNKMVGVGTVILHCKDMSLPHLYLKNIKNPFQVRDLITELVERERVEKGFRIGEFHG